MQVSSELRYCERDAGLLLSYVGCDLIKGTAPSCRRPSQAQPHLLAEQWQAATNSKANSAIQVDTAESGASR